MCRGTTAKLSTGQGTIEGDGVFQSHIVIIGHHDQRPRSDLPQVGSGQSGSVKVSLGELNPAVAVTS